jgi:hypothetical protein
MDISMSIMQIVVFLQGNKEKVGPGRPAGEA